MADIKRSLNGKKILVLGDDHGSLSELLRRYGAESYGIEINKFELLVARSGIMSISGLPQEQVFEGNIGDFFGDQRSDLLEKLKELGPFDMIVSNSVFNRGSGVENIAAVKDVRRAIVMLSGDDGRLKSNDFEKIPPSYAFERKLDMSDRDADQASDHEEKIKKMMQEYEEAVKTYNRYTSNFRNNCDDLLSDNGLQLHNGVDMEHIFDQTHVDALNKKPIIVPKNQQLRKRPEYIRQGL